MIVYKITDKINNKVYIGITTKSLEERFEGHLNRMRQGDKRHLYCAMRKYGIENFSIEQIDSALTYEELLEKEKYYIKLFNSCEDGYNLTYGGDTNPMEMETVKKAHDQKMREQSVRDKISQTMKEKYRDGKLFSEEHKKHLSDASFKRYGNINHIKKRQRRGNESEPHQGGPNKGRKALFDLDGNKKYVSKAEVDDLLKIGWTLPTSKKRGELPNLNTKQKHVYKSHMSAEEKHEILSKSHLGISPSNKGVPLSDEAREKLSNYFKGTKWVNNGKIQKQVQPNELQQYLSNGFVLGQLKNKNKKEGDAK